MNVTQWLSTIEKSKKQKKKKIFFFPSSFTSWNEIFHELECKGNTKGKTSLDNDNLEAVSTT